MESENKIKQMDSLGTSNVWLNLVDHYTVKHHDCQCKEHQQGLDPKLAPYTRQSINSKGKNPMTMNEVEWYEHDAYGEG